MIKIKKIFFFIMFGFTIFLLSRCSNNFGSNIDKANLMYIYDSGSTHYGNKNEAKYKLNAKKINNNVWRWQDYNFNYKGKKNYLFFILNEKAVKENLIIPSNEFWFELDHLLLKKIISNENLDINKLTINDIKTYLDKYGYLKFYNNSDDVFWGQLNEWIEELRLKIGIDKCPNRDFIELYKNCIIENIKNTNIAFITTKGGFYGNYGFDNDKTYIQKKNWSYIFSKGFFEGMVVYPIVYSIDFFTDYFNKLNNKLKDGYSQILALFLVILILKLIISLLYSFRATLGQQKVLLLQSKINKIQQQARLNSNNIDAFSYLFQKQKIQLLYKQYKINQKIIYLDMIMQIPIMILILRALNNSTILFTGNIFGLDLNLSIKQILFKNSFHNKIFWLSLLFYIIVVIVQILGMKISQIMQKIFIKKGILNISKQMIDNSKEKFQNNITIIFSIILSIAIFKFMSISICFYWLTMSLFNIVQMIIIWNVIAYQIKKRKFNL